MNKVMFSTMLTKNLIPNQKRLLKSLIAIVALLISYSSSYADEEYFDANIQWEMGDVKKYLISKTRQKNDSGSLKSIVSSLTEVEVEVIAVNESGYTLSWKFGEIRLADPEKAKNPFIQAMLNLSKDLSLILEIDVNGSILDITNWQEIQEKMLLATSISVDEIRKSAAMDETQIRQIEDQIKSMFSTREQVIQHSTMEVQMFLLPMGRRYSLSEPIEYDDLLPNPFGGNPFPAIGKLTLESIDSKANSANINWSQELNQKETTRIMREVVSSLATEADKPAPDINEIPNIEINETGSFEVSLSTGWLKQMKHVRSVITGDDEMSDILSIVLQ